MNGLEAIELMKQGKMIESDSYFTRYIKDGVMYSVTPDGDVVSNDFDINYEEYRECKHKPLTGWERTEHWEDVERFYIIAECDVLADRTSYNHVLNQKCYENANYFSTKEKAEEINFKQTLFRKLQRFSDENGGNEIDWNDGYQCKYFISYNHHYRELEVDCRRHRQDFGKVYFVSKKNAKKAIELFRDDLIKYFTM